MASDPIARHFGAMFRADLDAEDYYERFVPYTHDADVGAVPWWPSLSEVWRWQGRFPEDQRARAVYWREAWELLRRLRDGYEAAKPGA